MSSFSDKTNKMSADQFRKKLKEVSEMTENRVHEEFEFAGEVIDMDIWDFICVAKELPPDVIPNLRDGIMQKAQQLQILREELSAYDSKLTSKDNKERFHTYISTFVVESRIVDKVKVLDRVLNSGVKS